MKTGTLMTRWSAVLCAVLLMISLFAVPVFADTEAPSSAPAATESASAGEPASESASESVSESASESKSESASESASASDTTASTGSSSEGAKDEGLSITAIIWIVLGAIIVIVLAVLGIKYREKVVKGLRTYKSEFKKVSWLSWEQTRKSTFVVIVILVAFALVIGLLDMGLRKGDRKSVV